jgi:hypothetical protein
LTENLDCLLHEFNIIFVETATGVRRLNSLQSLDLLGVVVTSRGAVSLGASRLLFLTDTAHLNCWTCSFFSLRCISWNIVIISHQLPCLFDKGSVAATFLHRELIVHFDNRLLVFFIVVHLLVLLLLLLLHDILCLALLLLLLLCLLLGRLLSGRLLLTLLLFTLLTLLLLLLYALFLLLTLFLFGS